MNFKLNAAKALLGAAMVAGTVAAVSRPASAISFNISPPGTTTSPFAGSSINIDFQNGNVSESPISTYTEDGITYSGASPSVRIRSNDSFERPDGGNGRYLDVEEGNPVTTTFGTTGVKGYFGLLWGSINPTNSVAFFRNVGDTTAFQTFTGQQILNRLGGASSNTDGNVTAYVNFFGDNYNDTFAKVLLSAGSGNLGFQSDNHAFRRDIPTPALLPGLLGIGVAALRKKRKEAAE